MGRLDACGPVFRLGIEGRNGFGIETLDLELGPEFFGVADRGEDLVSQRNFAEKKIPANKPCCARDEQGFHEYAATGVTLVSGRGGFWRSGGLGGVLTLDAIFFDHGLGVVVGIREFEEIIEHLGVAGLDLLGLLDARFALLDVFGKTLLAFDGRGKLAIHGVIAPFHRAGGLSVRANLSEEENRKGESQECDEELYISNQRRGGFWCGFVVVFHRISW